jgi:hypothetical protein
MGLSEASWDGCVAEQAEVGGWACSIVDPWATVYNSGVVVLGMREEIWIEVGETILHSERVMCLHSPIGMDDWHFNSRRYDCSTFSFLGAVLVVVCCAFH